MKTRQRPPATNNSVHFACFGCRKSFKQRGSSNWNTAVPERPFACPECKQPMVRLGRHFKAPSQRALRQWLKIELLYAFGERFHSGNSGLGRKCATLASTVAYLSDAGHAEVRKCLERIRVRRAPKRT